mgnify:CR=1 FL=1
MLWIALLACTPMPSSGNIFEPVKVEAPPAGRGPDERFDDVAAPRFKISSEEMTGAAEANAPAAELSPADAAIAAGPPTSAGGVTTPAVGLPSPSRFPVRLVSTVASAQPPRAIIGLPSGEEVVVSPGSVLASEGLVVMAIKEGEVELAKITPNGDHAVVTAIAVSAQYP